MEKGSDTERSRQDQSSPGVLKGSQPPQPVGYETQSEYIDDLPPDSIQPSPFIPDYKTLTLSIHPIVVRTPEGCFCIDGWHYIKQAKADGLSTIHSHIFEIRSHSDIELAIRKAAVRVMPQGGKCSYAELVRNTHRLREVLDGTSDDLVLFAHGGDRRSVAFTDSKEKSIVAVLASRLGKSPTTISKYLQHGKGLNDEAMEELVGAGAPKLFFEAFQVQKKIEMAPLEAEQEDKAAIVTAISKQVPIWLNEFQRASMSGNSPTEDRQRARADRFSGSEVIAVYEDEIITPAQRTPPRNSDMADVPPAIGPSPEEPRDTATELKSIGEALIAIAGSQPLNDGGNTQALKDLITRLCLLLPRILNAEFQEDGGKEGRI